MTQSLVDFHCHLDLFPNHVAEFANCDRDGVRTLAVTTTPKAWPRNRDLAAQTRHVRAALGLHPQLVAERSSEFAIWEQYLPQARYIGEVGLDAGPRFYRSLQLQKQVFERVLKLCADVGGKILTVHTVRAATSVLDMIAQHLPATRGSIVLHWFTGSRAEVLRAVDLGCYFSINAEMLRNERYRTLVAAIPLDRLLTETDGPFTQHDGEPTRPRHVAAVVEMLGWVRHLQPATVASLILTNLDRLESRYNAQGKS